MRVAFTRATVVLVVCALAATSPSAQARAAEQVFAAIYSRGPAWTTDQAAAKDPKILEHVEYFAALGVRLIGAGTFSPVAGDGPVGMVLLTAPDEPAALAWARADPAVVAGVMQARVVRWRVQDVRAWSRSR